MSTPYFVFVSTAETHKWMGVCIWPYTVCIYIVGTYVSACDSLIMFKICSVPQGIVAVVFPLNETNLFSLKNTPFPLPIRFNDIFLQHTLHHIKQLQRCKPTFMSKVCACVEWGRDLWKQKQTVRHAQLDPILLEGPAASRRSQRDIRLETWLFWFSVPAGLNRQMANQCWGNFSLWITHPPTARHHRHRTFDILRSYICTIAPNECFSPK